MIDVMAAEGDDDMEQDNSQLVNQEASDGEDDTLHHRSHRTGIYFFVHISSILIYVIS